MKKKQQTSAAKGLTTVATSGFIHKFHKFLQLYSQFFFLPILPAKSGRTPEIKNKKKIMK